MVYAEGVTETTVITNEEPDPSVLAEAAVLSAAVAGAAAERATNAETAATNAETIADEATALASLALTRPEGVSEERAREIAREETETRLAAILAKAEETPAPVTVEQSTTVVDPQVAPKSVEKANNATQGKKKRWSDSWYKRSE